MAVWTARATSPRPATANLMEDLRVSISQAGLGGGAAAMRSMPQVAAEGQSTGSWTAVAMSWEACVSGRVGRRLRQE